MTPDGTSDGFPQSKSLDRVSEEHPHPSIAAWLHAPIQEKELLVNALTALIPAAVNGEGDGGFHAPTIMEFFPDIVLFEGTGFDLNRIMLIRILVTIVIVLVFWLGTRKMSLVPGRGQSLIEMGLNFVREGISEDLLGKKDGTRFNPLITTMFFMVLAMRSEERRV